MAMSEQTTLVFERMLGLPAGKGLPERLLETYERAKFASDRIQNPDLSPRELVMIALVAGVLPGLPKVVQAPPAKEPAQKTG